MDALTPNTKMHMHTVLYATIHMPNVCGLFRRCARASDACISNVGEFARRPPCRSEVRTIRTRFTHTHTTHTIPNMHIT